MKYAIVEQMGHRRFAALVDADVVAGAAMLRVTIPAWETKRNESRYVYAEEAADYDGLSGRIEREVHEAHAARVVHLGAASIFAISWCDAAHVNAVLASGATEAGPVTRTESPWRPRRDLLPPRPEAEAAPADEDRVADDLDAEGYALDGLYSQPDLDADTDAGSR